MMSTRWIMAPAVALIVLMTSWALAAKEEPGVGAADAEASRVVPDGMPELPFRMEWKPIIDGLPQAIYDGLPNKPAAPETGEAALPYGDDGALATPPGPETPTDKSVWESSLAAREQALARTQATLAREMKRSEDILARAEAKLEEARLIRHYAEKACGGSVIGGGPVKGVLPPTPEELSNYERIVHACAVGPCLFAQKAQESCSHLVVCEQPKRPFG